MKCKAHPTIEAIAHCLVCDSPVCKGCIANGNESAPQCARCVSFNSMAETENAQIIQTEQLKQQEAEEKERISREKEKKQLRLKLGVIVFGLIIIVIQFILVNKPVSFIPPDKTDDVEMTDYCLLNLLEISALLKQEQFSVEDFRCPHTNTLYRVTHKDGDIVVSDPNPEFHGYLEMSVSKNNPEPTLIEDPGFEITGDSL